MKTTPTPGAAWAGLLLLAMLTMDAPRAHACDDLRSLELEALGTSRGQVVFFVSELWEKNRCGGGSRSSARFELRFTTADGAWTPRRVPVSSFRFATTRLPRGLRGTARRKARAMARRLPGFVAAKVHPSIGCKLAGPLENQNPKISLCGKVLRYDDSGAKPVVHSTLPGTPRRWHPSIAPGTLAYEAVRRWLQTSTAGREPYFAGRKWFLGSVERFGIGPKTIYVLNTAVPGSEAGTPEWSVSIFLPLAAGAPTGVPAHARGTAAPARP